MNRSILVHLKTASRNQRHGLLVSGDVAVSLGLKNKEAVILSLGQRTVKTRVFVAKLERAAVHVPPALWSALKIPHTGMIHLKRENQRLRLGPLVGILTTGVRSDPKAPVGARTSFFRHLLSAQKEAGVYYFVFSPQDVNKQTQTVNALFLIPVNGKTVWKKITVPLPDVVYDRVPNRTSERMAHVRSLKQYLREHTSVKIFNNGFFNKWEIHQLLSAAGHVSEHIPETYLSPNVQTVERMLRKHRMVYLKPSGGSLGLGIIKVTHHPRHGFFCRYNRHGQNVLKRFDHLPTLLRFIGAERRLSNYLVQQGIPLVKFGERPLDFRVHLHKNRQNRWEVVAIAAKAAGRGSVTTHVRTGGTVLSSSDVIRYAFGHRSEEVARRMRETAIALAEAIENALGQPLGEIGFDIGVDHFGRIWMFEANSKPGRSVFKHPSLKAADKISIRRILDYSLYLADF
ncbi:spore coat associated protein YheD [Bacillaceae bacterium]